MSEETIQPLRIVFEMSADIGALIGALAKAHKAFKPIIKSETNPFFKSKYADLATVIEATKDGLSDNGLAVVQPPAYERSTGTVQIVTLLAHESGQWIKSILDMPTNKPDAQGVGSAITYGRRYSFSAIINVASEQDDDANAAVSSREFKKPESEEEYDQRTKDQQCLTPFEIKGIDDAVKRTGKTEEEVEAYLKLIGVKRIEHVLRSDFQKFLQWANFKGKSGTESAKAILKPNKDGIKVPEKAAGVKSFDHAWPKLFGAARAKGVPEEDVKRYYREAFSVDHGTELTPLQFDEVVKWVDEISA